MAASMHRYPNRDALAEALAAGVAAVLAGGIATRGVATLAVSGGSTPKRFFEVLSQAEIDWADVTVLLVDERWVPETNERSNAALVRRHLLQGPAAAAHFEPFYMEAGHPHAVEGDLCSRFAQLVRPLDVVILGMGGDGHTASFFPGADRLGEAIDPAGKAAVVAIEAPGAGEPRVTLCLPVLVDARFLALHIEGEEKLRVLETAQQPGRIEDLPVRSILRAPREKALEIFWAP
ncbi:6-phosphogluconolactonase [Mangrovicella endophytica]|uniref:6-phosphogluconolactonase n=1 Tax=Mangrovicella endophytica TaxID=2066697 RepID=UPI000C9DB97E|nr:6-phosphogluconolactonase [Mangrovicella endophytica]